MPAITVQSASQRQMLVDMIEGLPTGTRADIGELMNDLSLDFVEIDRTMG